MTEKTIIEKLIEPLKEEDIELRVGSCFEKGFTLLLYKTARADVKRLNDVCGLGWKNRHFYDNEKLLCCEISIYDSITKEWIGRSDVGTESNTEKEKGHYSDSFKRAGFRWGIGIELYNSPFVYLSWDMKLKESNGKKRYEPSNFYTSNLSLKDYQVKNNAPYFTLLYSGKEVWSNLKELPKEEDNLSATSGTPQKAGFKTAKEANDTYKEKLNKLKAISTIGDLLKAKKSIEEFIEKLALWDEQIAESFRNAYEEKRKDIGDIDDEIPTFE